jgi:hypothetical protein
MISDKKFSTNIKSIIMKTLKILLVSLTILTASVSKSLAGGNENAGSAYTRLNEQLKGLVKQISNESNVNDLSGQFVVLTFSVNRKHQIKNVQVESTNDDLSHHIQKIIVREKVKVDPLFDGKKGQVSMLIENEG